MDCCEVRKQLDDLLVTRPDEASRSALGEHLKGCPRCARDFMSARFVLNAFELSRQHSQRFHASSNLKDRIVNEIARVIEQGVPLRHILVLLASWQGVEALQEALNQRLGRNTTKDPKDTPPGDFVRVTTINAGTGLESPIVFVAGIHELFEQEGSLLLGEDERAELVRENTRKLYMAFTRAGQRLILTCVGNIPVPLEELALQGLLESG